MLLLFFSVRFDFIASGLNVLDRWVILWHTYGKVWYLYHCILHACICSGYLFLFLFAHDIIFCDTFIVLRDFCVLSPSLGLSFSLALSCSLGILCGIFVIFARYIIAFSYICSCQYEHTKKKHIHTIVSTQLHLPMNELFEFSTLKKNKT